MLQGNSQCVRGITGAGHNHVTGESGEVDCWFNMLPWAGCGELQNRCRQQTNAANWSIPATINPRAPVRLGGCIEPLPGQGPSHPGGPQHGHHMFEESSGPTGCIFFGVLWAGGYLGSFLTAPLLPQPTDVVQGPSRAITPIPVWLLPGIA